MALLIAAPARAATVRIDVHYEHNPGLYYGTAVFTAAPGEANRLTVSTDESNRRGFYEDWVFRDNANVRRR